MGCSSRDPGRSLDIRLACRDADRVPAVLRILGPIEVVVPRGEVVLGGAKERCLLAVLAVHTGEVVAEDRLVDALWGATPPRTAAKTLQNYVLRLRRRLEDCPELAIVTRAPGYLLAGSATDVRVAESLVAEARSAAAGVRTQRRSPGSTRCWRCGAGLRSRSSPTGTSRGRRRRGSTSCARRSPRTASTPYWPRAATTRPSRTASGWSQRNRCASGGGPSSCSRCTATGGRGRRSRPTGGCVTCWPSSSASTPGRRPARWRRRSSATTRRCHRVPPPPPGLPLRRRRASAVTRSWPRCSRTSRTPQPVGAGWRSSRVSPGSARPACWPSSPSRPPAAERSCSPGDASRGLERCPTTPSSRR